MTMKISAAVLAAFLFVPSLGAQPLQKSAVSGVVVNSDGEPIPNIRVTLGKLGVDLGPLPLVLASSRSRTVSGESLADMISLILMNPRLPPEAAVGIDALKALRVDEIYEVTSTTSGVPAVVYKNLPPLTTDALGRFSFTGVDAGSYKLTFSGNGYASQDYSRGASLTLPAEKPNVDVVMRLVKLGAISGVIRDAEAQPVVGVPVELLRFIYDSNGQRKNERVAITRTNDSGEYRFYAVPPGNYRVRAGGQAGTSETLTQQNVADVLFGFGYSTPNRIPQFHSLTYYPGTTDIASAIPIELRAGTDLRGIDLLVSVQRPVRISGRVVDARTDKPSTKSSLQTESGWVHGPRHRSLEEPRRNQSELQAGRRVVRDTGRQSWRVCLRCRYSE
jgi:hypothetical protein